MFHRVQIDNDNGCHTTVKLDDKPLRCSGYRISQYAGEMPSIEFDVFGGVGMFFENAKIEVSDLDNLIEIMDADMFNEFCDRWKEKHDYTILESLVKA